MKEDLLRKWAETFRVAGDHAAVIADHPVWNAELGEAEPLEMHLCDGAVVCAFLSGFRNLGWF